MDDKLFEERMQQLKKSYEHIPTVSSSEKIMNKVKMNEKPMKKRVFFQLPYVASFIGVLLLGGILGIQLLSNTDQLNSGEKQPTEEIEKQPVTDAEIETSINEIRGFYERKVDELNGKLDFEDVEQYRFVQEAKNAVENFESRKEYASKVELTTYMEKVKEIIELRVSMPYDEMQLLDKMRNEERTLDDQYILHYINKLESMHERYYDKWYFLQNNNQAQVTNVTDYVEKLNSGNVKDASNEYLSFVKEINDNGYTFVHEGEGMIGFNVDYERIEAAFSGNITKELEIYLEILKEKSIKSDGELTISREQLENRLLELELAILKIPTFKDVEKLKVFYQDAITLYLTGIVNQPITNNDGTIKEKNIAEFESFIKAYPNTETANIVKSFLVKLEENNFILSNELKEKAIETIPSQFKPAINEGLSENLLPITDQMISRYEGFKDNRNSEIYEGPYTGTNTIELAVARIYMYAIVEGDYETAYHLTYNGAGSNRPNQEEFVKEMQKSSINYQSLSNEVTKVLTKYEKNGEEIEHIFIKDSGETVSFRMRLENGYPKVEYNPK